MFTAIIWLFLVIETFVMGAPRCRCDYEHPQKQFCEKKFVLRLKIHEEVKMAEVKAFRVEIKRIFKGDIRELDLEPNWTAILIMHPWCVVKSMKTGDTYIIFGYNRNGYIYTISCHANLPWKKASLTYRRALSKYYKRNCDCAPDAIDTTTQRSCKSYSFMRRSGYFCEWVETNEFLLCKESMRNGTYWK